MSGAKIVRYYIKRIRKQIRNMGVVKKKLIVVGAGALVIGLAAGNVMGHSSERREANKQIEAISTKLEKEKQKTKKAAQKAKEEAAKKEKEEKRDSVESDIGE